MDQMENGDAYNTLLWSDQTAKSSSSRRRVFPFSFQDGKAAQERPFGVTWDSWASASVTISAIAM